MMVESTEQTVFCKINVKYFPFDVQHCLLSYASWFYDTTLLKLYKTPGVKYENFYVDNGEWELESVIAEE